MKSAKLFSTICIIYSTYKLYTYIRSLNYKYYFYKNIIKLPIISDRIQKKKDEIKMKIFLDLLKNYDKVTFHNSLPIKSTKQHLIIYNLKQQKEMLNRNWKGLSGIIYHSDENICNLQLKIYKMFKFTNLLHSDIFVLTRKLEAEVIRMTLSLFHGNNESCGVFTSGGTESIILACMAYRNRGYRKLGILQPEIIVPKTAHSAFYKACHILNIKIVRTEVNGEYKTDIKRLKKKINSNTILIVASAPCYPYGIIDNISKIADIANKNNVPVHVDCCLGGFLLPFMDKTGYCVDPFDFRISGVKSISADIHKYGFSPKGASVIMYRDKKLRKHQYSIDVNWVGGIYGTPCISGSRGGVVVAQTYATMVYLGNNGYCNMTYRIITSARYILNELKKIGSLYIFGKPETSVIAFGSDLFNIFILSKKMEEKGWVLNCLQFPPAVHICVTAKHIGLEEQFITDIKDSISYISKLSKKNKKSACTIYGTSQQIKDRSLVNDIVVYYLDTVFSLCKYY